MSQDNPDEEEFITIRVQDPRLQNEGSWASYVDYKIFLHTNSKAFTAKTSCVRRRYREFDWLRKRLQKNSGLVPVPALPGKLPFLVGNNDDFIERRRQGLQQFLEHNGLLFSLTICTGTSMASAYIQGYVLECKCSIASGFKWTDLRLLERPPPPVSICLKILGAAHQ
uniref:Sorting nexin 11 n=1 Tax=Xenopus tropicalis TaxID=8364 RepID=A0A803JLN1_XENTR